MGVVVRRKISKAIPSIVKTLTTLPSRVPIRSKDFEDAGKLAALVKLDELYLRGTKVRSMVESDMGNPDGGLYLNGTSVGTRVESGFELLNV